ncbi:MAG TPA: BON domain-containing protein [Pirellulales bacterium]|nr:BON domain-containing protein [Pirellulales bacterium]
MLSATHGHPTGHLDVEGQFLSRGSTCVAGDIQQALRSSGYPALNRVKVAATGDGIVLRGRVPSYHLKQIAQEMALRTAPGERVNNKIDVGEGAI